MARWTKAWEFKVPHALKDLKFLSVYLSQEGSLEDPINFNSVAIYVSKIMNSRTQVQGFLLLEFVPVTKKFSEGF